MLFLVQFSLGSAVPPTRAPSAPCRSSLTQVRQGLIQINIGPIRSVSNGPDNMRVSRAHLSVWSYGARMAPHTTRNMDFADTVR